MSKPISFELTLCYNDKDVFRGVINHLIEEGVCDFQWERVIEGDGEKYQLSIQGSWSIILLSIAGFLQGDI